MITNSIKILHHLRQKAIRPSYSWHAMQFLANFLMGDGALFFNVKIKGEFASKTTYLFLELEVRERESGWERSETQLGVGFVFWCDSFIQKKEINKMMALVWIPFFEICSSWALFVLSGCIWIPSLLSLSALFLSLVAQLFLREYHNNSQTIFILSFHQPSFLAESFKWSQPHSPICLFQLLPSTIFCSWIWVSDSLIKTVSFIEEVDRYRN